MKAMYIIHAFIIVVNLISMIILLEEWSTSLDPVYLHMAGANLTVAVFYGILAVPVKDPTKKGKRK